MDSLFLQIKVLHFDLFNLEFGNMLLNSCKSPVVGLNMPLMKVRFGLKFFQVILGFHELLKYGQILRPHFVHLFNGLLPIEVIFL